MRRELAEDQRQRDEGNLCDSFFVLHIFREHRVCEASCSGSRSYDRVKNESSGSKSLTHDRELALSGITVTPLVFLQIFGQSTRKLPLSYFSMLPSNDETTGFLLSRS